MKLAEEKKGITVKIDAVLHAEVKQYIEQHGMTMAEFITLAVDNELHPKHQIKEEKNVGNMRTMAFQVPEELFQRIKGYLQRNNISQKQFVIGLIEDELEREQTERENQERGQQTADENEDEDQELDGDIQADSTEEYDTEEGLGDDPEAVDGTDGDSTDEDETEDEEETEGFGMSMGGM